MTAPVIPSAPAEQLQRENEALRAQLAQAQDALQSALQAMRSAGADALILPGPEGAQIFSLSTADQAFRVLIEGMAEGALTLNAEGLILYANQGLADMLGTPLDALIGTPMTNWVTPHSREALGHLLQQGDDRRRGELELAARDGSPRSVSLSVRKLDLRGMPALHAVVVTDLREHRAAELQRQVEAAVRSRRALLSLLEDEKRSAEALRETRDRLDSILSRIDQAVWSVDANTDEVFYLSQAAQAIYARPLEDFFKIKQLWLQLIHADDMNVVVAMNQAVREHGKGEAEFRILRPDGSSRWVHNKARLLRDPQGRPLRLDGILSDITERKLARQALLESEAQFRGIVEQSIAGFYILQDGKLAYCNPRYAEILGYASNQELIGRDAMSLVVEAERATASEYIRKRLGGEIKSMNYTITLLRKDGSHVDVGAHGSAATYRGRPAIIGLMQDISEKKRAEEEIKRYVAQLERAFMRTVEVATTLSEMRDPYTAGHEKRVAMLAVAMGAELGLDKQRLEGLRVAGYLHDIGKITIPSEILAKPGRLSAAEFTLIQQHPQASYDVLKDVEFPWPVAEIARQHHERMDGSGYPRGLKGEDILFDARLLAVADVVEAMSSHRPYRPGLGLDKALAEIEQGRGRIYDPAAVDACLRLFREKGYRIPD